MINTDTEDMDIVKLKKNGKIKLPQEIREKSNFSENDSFNILVCNDNILLKKLNCFFCGNSKSEQLIEFKGKMICTECLNNK